MKHVWVLLSILPDGGTNTQVFGSLTTAKRSVEGAVWAQASPTFWSATLPTTVGVLPGHDIETFQLNRYKVSE
jgi:hypothetical protein